MRNRQSTRRFAARIAAIAVGAVLPVMTVAAPALALHHDDGAPGSDPSLGAGLTILYFVVIPIAAFLIIAGLSVLPSSLSKPRYRPGKPWVQGENWFGDSAVPEADGAKADTAATNSARGGASAEW